MPVKRARAAGRWLRANSPWIQWVCLVVMLVVSAHLVQDSRHQADVNRDLIKRLDARQNALCVAVKNGRVVFKELVDANGLFIATRVSLIDCPGPPAPLHHQ